MQQATYKLKMLKCSWNVIKLGNSRNVWGWKRTKFLLLIHVSPNQSQIDHLIEGIKNNVNLFESLHIIIWGGRIQVDTHVPIMLEPNIMDCLWKL